jgi:plastocyanin
VAEYVRGTRAAWVLVLLASCAAPSGAATVTIAIDGMQFVPASVALRRGDTVVWVNRDLVAHTATAARVFDSHAIAPGASWSYVVRNAGRYDYVCVLHPTMKATLQVD